MISLLSHAEKTSMAQLLVRNLEDELVRELKLRAVRHGRSAEEEHRQILREALRPERPRVPLKAMLSQMPDLGEGVDLDRVDDLGRPVEL